jgi:hypothetical protein
MSNLGNLISRLLGSMSFLCIAALVAKAALGEQVGSDWQIFKVPEYGTRLDYPSKIFIPVGQAEKGVGQRFESSDGRAVLSVYARENEDNDTPASYLKRNLRQRGRSLSHRLALRESLYQLDYRCGGGSMTRSS